MTDDCGTTSASDDRIVIVGASLAGVSAARELREAGHSGAITVIGDELDPPYDRPPLSKARLTGPVSVSAPSLAIADLDVEWRTGVAASGLDRDARRVILADGDQTGFDRLVIATGRRARLWPDPVPEGVLTLRGLREADELRKRLDRCPSRVVVVGGGFIGCEIASSCRSLGLDVSLIVRGTQPLDGAVGAHLGALAADEFRAEGVDLHLSSTVASIDGETRVQGVTLDDGTRLAADVVVLAIGSLPNVEWLAGSGLDTAGGVAVDGSLRVLTVDGEPCGNIVAAGDVTRWAHPAFGDRLLTIEHWGNAVEQGRYAARTLLGQADAAPFVEIPRFWSTMFGLNVKSVGVPSLADEVVLVQGAIEDRRGVFIYGREGRCVAAVAVDSPRELATWEPLVVAGVPFPPRLAVPDFDGGAGPDAVPAGFPTRPTTRPEREDGFATAALASTP